MQIILARAEVHMTPVSTDGVDLGRRPKMQETIKASACVWLNDGTKADLRKAKDFAAKDGWTVFTYENEPEPLARARREMIELQKKERA